MKRPVNEMDNNWKAQKVCEEFEKWGIGLYHPSGKCLKKGIGGGGHKLTQALP